MPTLIVAESVSLNGGEMFVVLVVLVAILLVMLAMLVGGCIWAYRAGRGSSASLVGAGVVAATALVIATFGVGSGGYVAAVMAFGVLALQAGLFAAGRSAGPNAPTVHQQPYGGGGGNQRDGQDGGGAW